MNSRIHRTTLAVFRPIIKPPVKASCRAGFSQGFRSSCHYSTKSINFHNLRFFHSKLLGVCLLTTGLIGSTVYFTPAVYAETAPTNEQQPRIYRLSEVKEHGKSAERKWVIRGTRVYDVTDWIPCHPGGDVILRAVGGAVDQYWKLFTIHDNENVRDILNEYYIGDIDPRDLINGQLPEHDIIDPFQDDPQRDPKLQMHTARPFNAETPSEELESFLTPNNVHFVRNHLWVPPSNGNHTLDIELQDGTEKSYVIDELKTKFVPVTVTVTLQCAGNRRRHMTENARQTNGLKWGIGGISTAEWTGVRLRDILADVGFPVDDVPSDVKHAQFSGLEAYGASIPIQKAVDKYGDVILAYEMNGRPIPPDHGFPLRVIVPGHTATRSVKFVSKISLSDVEASTTWQQHDYKVAGPSRRTLTKQDWESMPAIQELPVQSAITSLKVLTYASSADREVLQAHGLREDAVLVQGYAFSGGGRRIIRVDVSSDGTTWMQAELVADGALGHKSWAWKRWKVLFPKRVAGDNFAVKAVDESYNTQPGDDYAAIWNVRGLLTNAWHRVRFTNT